MHELDVFESRFAAAYRRYVDEAPTQVDAAAVARTVAASRPRPRAITAPWALRPARTLSWVVLGALLLAALGAAALVAGSLLERKLPAVVPPVGPTLACPPGTNPDRPGPVGQARPPIPPIPPGAYMPLLPHLRSPMAFDRDSGRIVLLVTPDRDAASAETWTFDVCTNTWTRMNATGGPGPEAIPATLVYDAGSDLTIGVDADGTTWAYDLDADRWLRNRAAPPDLGFLVYDPVADRVLALDKAVRLWAYDVDTDAWTPGAQSNPPAQPKIELIAYDASVDRIVAARPRRGWPTSTWLFDPRAGTWSEAGPWYPSLLSEQGAYATDPGGEHAYDEATGRTLVLGGGLAVAYDAAADRWHPLGYTDSVVGVGPTNRIWPSVAYDPVNERLVVLGGKYWMPALDFDEVRSDDVLAYDPATGEWTVLLEAATVERW